MKFGTCPRAFLLDRQVATRRFEIRRAKPAKAVVSLRRLMIEWIFSGLVPLTLLTPLVGFTGLAFLSRSSQKKQREFEEEAIPHMDVLYNFALRTTGNEDDANDLLQETYLKAYRFWDKYEKGTNIRAWLFRIMKNSYINRYRKETKEPDTVDYENVENFYNSIRAESTDPNDLQQKLFGNMLGDEVSKALARLPDDFRTVVILCDIEGMTYEEIAEFLDIPIGTVRSRLHRGRKLLQQMLFEYAQQQGILGKD